MMKFNFVIFLIVLLTSCSLPSKRFSFVPKTNDIKSSKFGSFIKIQDKTRGFRSGEIITVDSTKIVILIKESKLDTIFSDNTGIYYVRYAKPKFYLWTLAFLVSPFISDIGALLFMTEYSFFITNVNLAGALMLSLSGNFSGKLIGKTLTLDELKTFARYPQGIPEGFDVKLLTNENTP